MTTTMTATKTDDISKLPRTKSYQRNMDKHGNDGDCCELCGKKLAVVEMMVVTSQGCYPVGTDCAKSATKAGFEIEAA